MSNATDLLGDKMTQDEVAETLGVNRHALCLALHQALCASYLKIGQKSILSRRGRMRLDRGRKG